MPNAIRVAKEVLEPMGKRLKGIRLDSGDLAYLSKKSRAMLDEAGLTDCRIVASNSLDEMTISSLLSQGAKIDIFGVGERLITARSEPVFGAVYKLVAVEENGRFAPRIKISENVEKVTNPGLKRLLRVYDQHGKSVADLLTLAEEPLPGAEPYRFVDPVRPWRIRHFENCRFEDMQVCVFKGGKLMYQPEPLDEVRAYVQQQLSAQVWEEEQRFENPHVHYVDMSPRMYELKMSMLDKGARIAAMKPRRAARSRCGANYLCGGGAGLRRRRTLTKSTDCQSVEKATSQGSLLAAKGAYMDVSNRRRQGC